MEKGNVIRITLLGDIFPGELPFTLGYGIRSQFKKHYGVPWLERICSVTGGSDLVIGNLESPLVKEASTVKPAFYGQPEFATFLKKCGINILNIANNHIMEQGAGGFHNTVGSLEAAGLGITGYDRDGSHTNIIYREINGRKTGIAGFSNVDLNVIRNDNCFSVLNEENVIWSLEEMNKADADLKILCFHWGNEYIHIPAAEQRRLARRLIDCGADIIAGHHPHVVQPYEKYSNGHIFYSLGNFIFDFLHSGMVKKGLVAKLTIDANNEIRASLSGIKLSYKNIITEMPENRFRKFYSGIEDRYMNLASLDDKDYSGYYNSRLRINHLWQRILMKTSIVSELFRIRWRDKSLLLRNVINYYMGKK